jgi:muramoyltetrapeptide carboxypeptidase
MKGLAFSGRVGVAAPSSAPRDKDAVDRGAALLRARGLDLHFVRHQFPESGYLAGPDKDRADELNALLRDPTIRMILCARGGYGSLRLLDRIDYDAARRNSPVVVGYSDITAIQLALFAKSAIPSVSGPMVAVEWGSKDGIDELTDESFWRLLSDQPFGEVASTPYAPLRGVRNGVAEGTLLGGNLSVLTRLIGTPYLPDFTGAVLFLEDVGESPYRIDGMLAQLRHSGILNAVAGVLLGEFTESDDERDKPTLTREEVLGDYFGDLSCPVVASLPYGHVERKASIPIGIRARVEVEGESAAVTITEALL